MSSPRGSVLEQAWHRKQMQRPRVPPPITSPPRATTTSGRYLRCGVCSRKYTLAEEHVDHLLAKKVHRLPQPPQTFSQSGLRWPQPHLQSPWSRRRDLGGTSDMMAVCGGMRNMDDSGGGGGDGSCRRRTRYSDALSTRSGNVRQGKKKKKSCFFLLFRSMKGSKAAYRKKAGVLITWRRVHRR